MTNQPDVYFFILYFVFSMIVLGAFCLSVLAVYFILKRIKKRKKLKETDDEGDH